MRKHGAFLLAVPMLPTEAPDAASRPGGRLAVGRNGGSVGATGWVIWLRDGLGSLVNRLRSPEAKSEHCPIAGYFQRGPSLALLPP